MEQVAGVKNVTLSLPHLLGGQGVLNTVHLNLQSDEEMALRASAQLLRSRWTILKRKKGNKTLIPSTTETLKLGKSELQISPMGIGAWAWGDRYMWNYGSSHNEGDVKAAFQATLDGGINLIDTAEVYGMGRSERFI